MKISEVKELPKLAAPGGRKIAEVSLDFLESRGTGIVTYGIRPNETIEFPDGENDIKVMSRQVRPNNENVETLILVKRNGKHDWFSISALRRMDKSGKFVGPVCEELRQCNDKERVLRMLGKSITCKEMTKIEVNEFNNGVQTGNTKTVEVPVIVYA